jgi:tRNA/rRNA methyltransferase
VLVRPETAANVGASARIVRNMAAEGLDLVAPGDWRTVECWRSAWGAQDVLEQARVFPDLSSALADSRLAVGFSARAGGESPRLDVRQVAGEVAVLGRDDRAALVFGPETSGLDRDERALCGRLASIPSDARQPSLNLSHAVAVAAYEVFRTRRPPEQRPRLASHAEKLDLARLLRAGRRPLSCLARPDRAL